MLQKTQKAVQKNDTQKRWRCVGTYRVLVTTAFGMAGPPRAAATTVNGRFGDAGTHCKVCVERLAVPSE
jgi:hypothetical protein